MPRLSHVTVEHNDRRATVVLTDGKRFRLAGEVAPVASLVALDEDETRELVVDKIKTVLVAAEILREALVFH
jgi:hypothetical protein